MKLLEEQITTERLCLLPLSFEYERVIFSEFDESITRYMFPRPAADLEETRRFISNSRRSMGEGKDLVLAITEQEGGAFLGCCGIHRLRSGQPELGIWIRKDAHGKGYGTETIAALVRWANRELEFEYLIYPVDERNLPSRRLPEKLGGRPFRTYEQKNESGNMLRVLVYRIFPADSKSSS